MARHFHPKGESSQRYPREPEASSRPLPRELGASSQWEASNQLLPTKKKNQRKKRKLRTRSRQTVSRGANKASSSEPRIISWASIGKEQRSPKLHKVERHCPHLK